MSTITSLASGDNGSASRTVINTNFSNLNTDKIETSVLDTDTALTANSDAKIPSQKAVKAYVDAGGNVNASETTRGIVEEATDAEVTAGTATGGTSAKLFVTPAKLLTYLTSRLSGVPTTTIFQQAIPCLSQLWNGFTCTTDGSAFYVVRNNGGTLYRYEKDSITNQYLQTHTVTPAGSTGSFGMAVIGSYLYVFDSNTAAVKATRYLASDLTGAQAMTVPALAVTPSANVKAWTDGTFAYVVSADSQTTSNKWSVSGTTFSASATATITTGIFVNANSGSMWDGTNAWIVDNSISTTAVTLRKLTSVDGSAYTTTTKNLAVISGVDTGALAIPIGTTGMYIGKISNNFNATVDVGSTINLFPITRP